MLVKVEKRPLPWFKPDSDQPRKFFDPEKLREMNASLRKRQLVPLLAKGCGLIVDGEYRWRAAGLGGIETLDVQLVPDDIGPAEVKEIQLVTALHRTDLCHFEQAVGARDWLALHKAQGALAKDLAARIDRDPSMISKLLLLWDCTPAVQKAAAEQKITLSDWIVLAKLPPQEMDGLLALRLSGQINSRADLTKHARQKLEPQAERVQLDRCKLVLPSGVTIAASGAAMDIDRLIEALSEALKAAQKAQREKETIKTLQSSLKDKSKAS